MSRRAVQLLPFAGCLLAILALVWLLQRPAAVVDREPDPVGEVTWSVLRPGALDAERGAGGAAQVEPLVPGVPSSSAAGGPAASTPRGLTVRVLSASPRRPLAGATVWLLAETPRSLVEGWACLARTLAGPLATDADGRVTLSWGEPSGARRVVASAPGHTAAELRLEADAEGERTLALPTGLTLKGRVVDRFGAAQAGLALEVRAVARPLQELEERARGPELAEPGFDRATAVSAEDGSFAFDGLSPGTYSLEPEEPGWVVEAPAPSATADPVPGSRGLMVRAGDTGARLIVGRVGLVALMLVDAGTARPVVPAWVTASVRVPGQAEATTVTSYAGRALSLPADAEAPLVLDPAQQRGGRLLAVVPWDVRTSHAEVEVRAAGYRPARVEAPLHPVASWGARAGGAGVAVVPEKVALESEQPPGPCRLVLDCRREVGAFYRPATRLLTLCRPVDGARVHVGGRKLAEGERWEFDGLPEGEAVLQVWDGLSHSLPLTTALKAGEPAEQRIEFGPPTGALFVIKSGGRRTYDADALLVTPKGWDHGLPDRSEATRLRLGQEVLLPLTPGEYRFGVAKHGVGYATGSFTVGAGEIVRVEAKLAMPKAPDR